MYTVNLLLPVLNAHYVLQSIFKLSPCLTFAVLQVCCLVFFLLLSKAKKKKVRLAFFIIVPSKCENLCLAYVESPALGFISLNHVLVYATILSAF